MTFIPSQPEQKVSCLITHREADLLAKLRKYAYGQFTVQKANGIIVRLEVKESLLIDADGKVDLT